MKPEIKPINLKDAKAFIDAHHRHHKSPVGWKFGSQLVVGDKTVGVVIAGRPVSRHQDDGRTLEVTRLCVVGSPKNACSMLYGSAKRAAKALGYTRVITYTLASEEGGSLRASGFQERHRVKGQSWSVPSRPRIDKHPTVDKTMWEAVL